MVYVIRLVIVEGIVSMSIVAVVVLIVLHPLLIRTIVVIRFPYPSILFISNADAAKFDEMVRFAAIVTTTTVSMSMTATTTTTTMSTSTTSSSATSEITVDHVSLSIVYGNMSLRISTGTTHSGVLLTAL